MMVGGPADPVEEAREADAGNGDEADAGAGAIDDAQGDVVLDSVPASPSSAPQSAPAPAPPAPAIVAFAPAGTAEMAWSSHGTSDDDRISGGAGDDSIDGGSGDDLVLGGAGRDRILGGSGRDTIAGEAGADWIEGGLGDDMLDGGADRDRLFGNGGADTLLGGSGDDDLRGGEGRDILDGGDGNDILSGGPGRDRFVVDATTTGLDVVPDFDPGERDLLVIEGYGSFAEADAAARIRVIATPSGLAVGIELGDELAVELRGFPGDADAARVAELAAEVSTLGALQDFALAHWGREIAQVES